MWALLFLLMITDVTVHKICPASFACHILHCLRPKTQSSTQNDPRRNMEKLRRNSGETHRFVTNDAFRLPFLRHSLKCVRACSHRVDQSTSNIVIKFEARAGGIDLSSSTDSTQHISAILSTLSIGFRSILEAFRNATGFQWLSQMRHRYQRISSWISIANVDGPLPSSKSWTAVLHLGSAPAAFVSRVWTSLN